MCRAYQASDHPAKDPEPGDETEDPRFQQRAEPLVIQNGRVRGRPGHDSGSVPQAKERDIRPLTEGGPDVRQPAAPMASRFRLLLSDDATRREKR